MKILNVEQGSKEWLAARLGVVTASEMDTLVSPEGKVRTGQGPESYLYRKVCERILGYAPEASSWAMDQGTLLESVARPWYAFTYDVEVQQVGLMLTDDGKLGASPDGLVGEEGGVEIKSFQPAHALEVLLKNSVPKDNIVQVQTCLYVSKRKWWDFVSYSNQFPPVVIRCTPIDVYQDAIKTATAAFNAKFDSACAKIKGMRDAENQIKQAAYDAEMRREHPEHFKS
jgi:hypothetical protein